MATQKHYGAGQRSQTSRVRGALGSGGRERAASRQVTASTPRIYGRALVLIKRRIRETQIHVISTANAALVGLYWDIGQVILRSQARHGWGARVVDRLSGDLRGAFPAMRGFSARNLKYMRAFAAAWPERSIVQEALAQIPWTHHLALLEYLKSAEDRLWYLRQAARSGWSRAELVRNIGARVHKRQGKALTNFSTTLPTHESELASATFKDPYLFDFLGTADSRVEREVERALVDHIQRFLLELGSGFAFVGRQVPLRVSGHDFVVDLLFYHLKLRRFVVVELKAVPFEPSFVGQLNLYLSAVDDLLRHPDDRPTIGLLLCRERDRVLVEYALRHLHRPVGVAEWATKLVGHLPKALQASLPTIEQIEAELGGVNHSRVRPRRQSRR